MQGDVLLTLLLKTVIWCFLAARSASITSRATSVKGRQTRIAGLARVDSLRPVPPAIAILTMLSAFDVLIRCVKSESRGFEYHNKLMASRIVVSQCFNSPGCSTARGRILRRSFGGDQSMLPLSSVRSFRGLLPPGERFEHWYALNYGGTRFAALLCCRAESWEDSRGFQPPVADKTHRICTKERCALGRTVKASCRRLLA